MRTISRKRQSERTHSRQLDQPGRSELQQVLANYYFDTRCHLRLKRLGSIPSSATVRVHQIERHVEPTGDQAASHATDVQTSTTANRVIHGTVEAKTKPPNVPIGGKALIASATTSKICSRARQGLSLISAFSGFRGSPQQIERCTSGPLLAIRAARDGGIQRRSYLVLRTVGEEMKHYFGYSSCVGSVHDGKMMHQAATSLLTGMSTISQPSESADPRDQQAGGTDLITANNDPAFDRRNQEYAAEINPMAMNWVALVAA